MSSVRIGLKRKKTVALLIALRDPTIAAYLEPHGFREEHLEEGWRNYDLVTEVLRIKEGPSTLSLPPEIVAFRKQWYPLARIVLECQYPEVARSLYEGLSGAQGFWNLIVLGLFAGRLENMERGLAPFGPAGPPARQLLRDRGLSDEIVEGLRASMEKARFAGYRTPYTGVITPESRRAARRRAEDAMWAWYLEWSGIARVVVKDADVLGQLGFKKRREANRAAALP